MPAMRRLDSASLPLPLWTGGDGRDARTPHREQRVSALLARALRAELLVSQQATLLGLLAETLDESTLEHALDAFTGAVQRRFEADRVTLALADSAGKLELVSISQQALIDTASDEARLLVDAMDEACALERLVSLPANDDSLGVLAAHRLLIGRRANTALASVPLYHDTRLVGAVLIERRGEPWQESTCQLLERLAIVSAPLIALRREAAKGPMARLRLASGTRLSSLFGTERPGRALLAAMASLLLLLIACLPVNRYVLADAELVPQERRLVTSPVDGFIEEIAVTAGERVSAGQLLARLDRRELVLEASRRDSEIVSAEAELRSAMASHDRQATAIARARLERERALRGLIAQRLERSDLRAPIDGLIVSGDPDDIIGAPIERGQALFEIAPVTGHEVHLLVDQRDIRDIEHGHVGELSLRARSEDALMIRVESIHPVAESGSGASRFRVRAALDGTPVESLRPGETGTARLAAGRTTLLGLFLNPIGERLSELYWRLGG